MPNDQARAAMRNRLREAENRDEDGDRQGLPFAAYYEQLKVIADRRRDLADEQKDVIAEAKKDGFDAKTLQEVLKIAALLPDERDLKFQRLFQGLAAVGVKPDLGFHAPCAPSHSASTPGRKILRGRSGMPPRKPSSTAASEPTPSSRCSSSGGPSGGGHCVRGRPLNSP